ncbi:hypothetical protein [Solimonas sp. SE-A11]|uniref:hypothetical protein n=1 Tax=Solimonas sp. SE-A11 TaxID=3054954 RepID=UPI00259C75F4|nr:hypothetical protein [Solimonas sp. SE-A11]MDM4770492.1 hypothetical protein [Solimonas sp. SE-A11]
MTRNLLTVTGAAAGLVLLTLAAAEARAAEQAGAAPVAGGDATAVTLVRGADDRLLEARTRRDQVVRRLSPAFQIVP